MLATTCTGTQWCVFQHAWARGFCEEKTICEVVLWSGFVWSFFSQGATCNIMSSEFSLCQVAGVNVRATVHFWDWYVLVKKILPQLPEILPQLTQGKWFVLGTWFLTQTATRLNTFQSCWNKFTSDQKCLSVYEVYEALIFKYQDSQLPNGRLPVAKRWPWSTTPVLLVLQSTTPVLLCTTKYYSSTTLYYKVLLQYYSVLQSTTPVLLCTTKYNSGTTLYYRVLLCTTQYYASTTLYYKVLRQYYLYYNVLLQYYSVLPSSTPVLLCTTKYYSSTTPVLLCTTKYYSSPTLYYKVLLQYYSVLLCTTKYHSVLQSTTPVLLCTTPVLQRTTPVLLCTTPVLQRTTPVLLWNVIYIARRNKSHRPTSPNTAPATQNECRRWSAAHMKCHFQCVEQVKSPSNITKYCACHAKWTSSMICVTYETSFPMRGASKVTLQPHQILRLPRKMHVINDLRHKGNLISNAWSK